MGRILQTHLALEGTLLLKRRLCCSLGAGCDVLRQKGSFSNIIPMHVAMSLVPLRCEPRGNVRVWGILRAPLNVAKLRLLVHGQHQPQPGSHPRDRRSIDQHPSATSPATLPRPPSTMGTSAFRLNCYKHCFFLSPSSFYTYIQERVETCTH